jgi:hypothetical protein
MSRARFSEKRLSLGFANGVVQTMGALVAAALTLSQRDNAFREPSSQFLIRVNATAPTINCHQVDNLRYSQGRHVIDTIHTRREGFEPQNVSKYPAHA